MSMHDYKPRVVIGRQRGEGRGGEGRGKNKEHLCIGTVSVNKTRMVLLWIGTF